MALAGFTGWSEAEIMGFRVSKFVRYLERLPKEA